MSSVTGSGIHFPDPSWTWSSLTAVPPDEVRRARRVLLALGILALIAGAVAIVVPIVASVTMTLFIGWVLMFWGVVGIVHAVRTPAERSVKAWRILDGVLALAVGFYLVVLPLSGTITLTFLLSVWFFGTGLFALISAFRHRGLPGTGMATFTGLLSVILGVLIAVSLPSSAAWAIGTLVGIYMLWWGMGALFAAGMMRRAAPPRTPAVE